MCSRTPIPTPASLWNGQLGAYLGGYADTEPVGHSHKPGFACVMENGGNFCAVCRYIIVDFVDPTMHGLIDADYDDEYPG